MTKRKNPYESQETVDIPDFLERKTEIEDEIVDEEDYYEEKEVGKLSNRTSKIRNIKLNDKTLTIIGAVFAGLLLLALFGIILGISKSNALKAKEAEYQELVKTFNEKEITYQQTIKDLQAEVDKYKSGNQPSGGDIPVDESKQTKYVIIADVVNIRSQPTAMSDKVGELAEGDEITVYGDLVNDGVGNLFGKIGEGKWVCIYIDNGADGYAEER